MSPECDTVTFVPLREQEWVWYSAQGGLRLTVSCVTVVLDTMSGLCESSNCVQRKIGTRLDLLSTPQSRCVVLGQQSPNKKTHRDFKKLSTNLNPVIGWAKARRYTQIARPMLKYSVSSVWRQIWTHLNAPHSQSVWVTRDGTAESIWRDEILRCKEGPGKYFPADRE